MRFAWTKSIFLGVACMAAAQGVPEGAPPPSVDPETPALPRPKLAPLEGGTDELARLEIVAAQVATLAEEARNADDVRVRADGLLTAANRILSSQIEPLCSDRFLRIHRDEPASREDAVRDALDKAQSLINEAREALRTTAEAETHDAPDDADLTVADLQRRAGALEAFASAIRAYLMPDASSEPARQVRAAISRLSPQLEASEPSVAEAATFWQALLRSLDPDPRDALRSLEFVVTNVSPDAPRYGFFCRLLRCRLIAAQRGEPAALALLLQVEERIPDWFRKDPERLDATRTVGLIRMQILSAWRQRLDPAARADERAWCAKEIQRLRDERFAGGDDETVMRLLEAVPMPHTASPAPDRPRPTVPPPE